MSGRRRVKNVAYDEDEWGYGDDDDYDYWDEDDQGRGDSCRASTSSYSKKKNDKPSCRGGGAQAAASAKHERPALRGGQAGRSTGMTTSTQKLDKHGGGTGSTCSSSLVTSRGGTPGMKAGGSEHVRGPIRQKDTFENAGSDLVKKPHEATSCSQTKTKDTASKGGLNEATHKVTGSTSTLSSSSSSNSSASLDDSPDLSEVPEISKASPTTHRHATAARDSLCLVVIGHVDAGKSTLVGQLLLATGAVGERAVQKMKKLSGEAGKSSFFLAWLCDEGEDERERGVTIDISVRAILTKNKGRRLVLVDAPGHREFVCSMLAGAALADVALLVIDAPSFEVGLRGQTKEHLLVVRCLGIQHFVVALNKMDEVGWSKETYDVIVTRLRDYMTGPEIGCSASRITFVPVSAFTGVNVVRNEAAEDVNLDCVKDGMYLRGKKGVGNGRSHHSKDQMGKEEALAEKTVEREHLKILRTWWTGPSLLEALEDVELHNDGNVERQRSAEEPLVAVVSDAWSPSASASDLHVSLKILRGEVRTGETVIGMPENTPLVCRSLHTFGENYDTCVAGDYVERAVLSPAGNRNSSDAPLEVGVGSVLCEKGHLLPASTCFLSRLMVFQTDLPLVQGRQLVAYIHMFSGPCAIKKVVGAVDKKTGELLKKSKSQEKGFVCAALGRGMMGLVEIETAARVCVQPRERTTGGDQPTSVLSRIILREGGRTVAAGVILSTVN
ncbi:elongation factor tu gtp binding domain-containing protein [Cystoisospora suis]|uniref:Elongation factor tu gtp binding domain-containing protein n=1 Tax=Cystoisospora suis TaxID=483139 RepID=A0A2C6LF73_9APIC|nr:elongation factor tu gtp binding domain-containing protein [Cystoisospora suis]